MTTSVSLYRDEYGEVRRQGLHAVAELFGEYRVISTSVRGGGERRGIRHLVNYQISEGVRHDGRHEMIMGMGLETWHGEVCRELGLDPEKTVLMETAANMGNLAFAKASFEGVGVWCLATAGVKGNASAPAEAALWHEYADGIRKVPLPGTINVMLGFDVALTPGALARAVVTLTEAKSSVLMDLGVRAKNSWRPATGTGTDQFVVAAPLQTPGREPLKWVGIHAKMGELISQVVRQAVAESLTWQNGLSAAGTRNLLDILGFLGLGSDLPLELSRGLPEEVGALLKNNIEAVVHDPLVCAAAWALRELLVRCRSGNLPPMAAGEALLQQAALMASALAQKPSVYAEAFAALSGMVKEQATEEVAALVLRALQIGFEAKWKTV